MWPIYLKYTVVSILNILQIILVSLEWQQSRNKCTFSYLIIGIRERVNFQSLHRFSRLPLKRSHFISFADIVTHWNHCFHISQLISCVKNMYNDAKHYFYGEFDWAHKRLLFWAWTFTIHNIFLVTLLRIVFKVNYVVCSCHKYSQIWSI